ncbi:MAG: hypothetical protein ABSB18_07580 [Candidatus Omnitrophota bacterium]
MKLRNLFIFYLFLFFLNGCATNSRFLDKTTGISENSSDAIHGVRLYGGKLPTYIRYQSLGEVEGYGESWEVVRQMFEARENAVLQARALGANALINVKVTNIKRRMVYLGEAVKVEEYPDKFDESDPVVWSPVFYENSHIFNYPSELVFKAVDDILYRELYELEVVNQKDGIIETKEIEISNDKIKWTSVDFGGPYPKLKIRVSVRKIDDKTTQVIETDIVRGSRKKSSLVNKSSRIFFKEIENYLGKLKLHA